MVSIKSVLTKDQESLRVTLCQLVAQPSNIHEISTDMWELLVDVAIIEDMGPMLWYLIEKEEIKLAEPLQDRLVWTFHRASVMNMLFEDALLRVETSLRDDHIPTIWLKGLTLGHTLYPNSVLRPMADIDVLIPYAERERALEIVQQQGYYFQDDQSLLFGRGDDLFLDTLHHYPLRRSKNPPIYLEVHFRLLGRNKALLSMADLDLFWSETEPLTIRNMTVQMLAPDILFLYLCAHAIIQHGENDVGLFQYLDMFLLIQKGRLDWERIVDLAVYLRWSYAVESSLRNLETYFNVSLSDEVYTQLQTRRHPDENVEWIILRNDEQSQQWGWISVMLRDLPLKKRWRMILRILLPPPSYMKHRYDIQDQQLIWPYYFVRWFNQGKQVIHTAWRRLQLFRKNRQVS